MGGRGLEPIEKSSENPGVPSQGGAKSGALGAREALQDGPQDPDLQAVVDAWPDLPEALKTGILAMVRAAGGTP